MTDFALIVLGGPVAAAAVDTPAVPQPADAVSTAPPVPCPPPVRPPGESGAVPPP